MAVGVMQALSVAIAGLITCVPSINGSGPGKFNAERHFTQNKQQSMIETFKFQRTAMGLETYQTHK